MGPDWSDPPFLDHIGPVSPVVAQRIACDADVWRLILDPATGAPLDVGRSYRLVPHWLRRALHARDRGCRFPGCSAPSAWTDAHHLTPWAEGGVTSVEGCVLLCRHHHGLVHEGGWGIRMCPETGRVTASRPDGTPYLTTVEYTTTIDLESAAPPQGGPSQEESPQEESPRDMLPESAPPEAAPGPRSLRGKHPPGGGPGNAASARRSHPWRGPSSRAA